MTTGKTILTAIITLFLIVQGFGQKQCVIRNHYKDFITIQISTSQGKNYLIKQVVEPKIKSRFYTLVNNNRVFVEYLLTNFSSTSNYQHLLLLTDSIELRNSFFADLKQDSLFNAVMSEWVSKTMDKEVPKDSVSMDELLNVAVKFFSIVRITEEGYYVGKVCMGLNDIKKTESERNPFIEAFSFASILKHRQLKERSEFSEEEFYIYDEFVKTMKELYKVNLGIDKEERLLRAQGAMFMLMRNNETLKKMLKTEYEKQKEYVPFVLTD